MDHGRNLTIRLREQKAIHRLPASLPQTGYEGTDLQNQRTRQNIGLNTRTIEITPAGGARYTSPVAVLTSDATISAAEIGTLGLRALPNTRSFGRPTYGALSDPFYYRLPNGWRGAMSNEIYRASDGQVYEGVGIPPDHLSTEPSASAFWETLDAQLRNAEAWLLAL